MRFSLTVAKICLFAVVLKNTPIAPSGSPKMPKCKGPALQTSGKKRHFFGPAQVQKDAGPWKLKG